MNIYSILKALLIISLLSLALNVTAGLVTCNAVTLAKVDYAPSVVILLCEGEDHPLEIEGIIQVGYHKGRITVRSNGIDNTIRVSTTVEVAA